MAIGNPETAISRANFLLCFLEWFAPDRTQEIHAGPGHNSCYKRAIILSAFPDVPLEAVFSMEYAYQRALAQNGHRILIEPRALIHHWTHSTLSAFTRHMFHGGRTYGAARVVAERWGIGKKLLYTLSAGLIPIVRMRRIFAHLDTPDKRRTVRLTRTLPLLLWGVLLQTVGEVVGYLAGEGGSVMASAPYEFNRRDSLVPEERAALVG